MKASTKHKQFKVIIVAIALIAVFSTSSCATLIRIKEELFDKNLPEPRIDEPHRRPENQPKHHTDFIFPKKEIAVKNYSS